MSERSRFLKVPVEPVRVDPCATADVLLASMEKISFQGRTLAAASIYRDVASLQEEVAMERSAA